MNTGKEKDIEVFSSKKMKKTSGFAIYDALKGAHSNHMAAAAHSSQLSMKGLHSNAARWNELLIPKSFVMKKKRKKKLSTFKKRILMERLRISIHHRMESLAVRENTDTVSHSGVQDAVLHIFNFVDEVDLEDESEVMEVAANLRELLQSVGEILQIRIMVSSTGEAHAEVTFVDPMIADRAMGVLQGLVCGGQEIRTSRTFPLQPVCRPVSSPVLDSVVPESSPGSEIALYLHNLVSTEAIKDEDEVQEILNDIQQLCGVFGDVKRVWIEAREANMETAPQSVLSGPPTATASNLPWAVLHCSDLQDCLARAKALQSHVIAGCPLATFLHCGENNDGEEFCDEHLSRLLLSDAANGSDEENDNDVQHALRLTAFVNEEEIESEEERAEVLDNLRGLVESADGGLVSTGTLFVKRAGSAARGRGIAVDVLVLLPSLVTCATLHKQLQNRMIGGQALCADILQIVSTQGSPEGSHESSPLTSVASQLCAYGLNQTQLLSADGTERARLRRVCGRSGAAVLVVQNFFSAEDLEESDESGDLAVMKRDLLRLSLCLSGSTEDSIVEIVPSDFIQRVSVVTQVSTTRANSCSVASGASGDETDSVLYVAGVQFDLPAQAEEAMLHLDQRVVGGAELKAIVELCRSFGDGAAPTIISQLQKVASSSSPAPADPLTMATTTTTNTAELFCLYREEYTPNRILDGNSSSGRVAAPSAEPTAKVSKYDAARALPKLPKHEAPRLSIPIADEATNAAAKELLRLISTFQIRLKEKNPLRAKTKLRFVAGLKQCINSVKAGKVKLLLLAPNTEANDVFDEKVDTLIAEAQQRGVPVTYCLSKRILGKAAQMTMKQSAVAVLDPDGAYEFFKIVLRFVCPDR